MFKTINIKNLRAITNLEINNLGQVNLFVGQNSCGKTTFLESLFFLIGATNPKLPVRANIFRDLPFLSNQLWQTYFHNMDPNLPIEIVGQIRETMEEQRLLIRPRQHKSRVMESLPSDLESHRLAPTNAEPILELDGLELEYTSSQNPDDKTTSSVYLKKDQLIDEGAKDRPIRGVFVNPFTLSDWKDRFDAVQQKKQVPEVVSLLKKIEPRMLDLRLNRIGLLSADIGLSQLIPANLLGGGIAKFLSIALAMLDYKDGIVLIDEIENGLHHSAQQKLWRAVINWAQELNVQVFATTHSNECIKAFTICAKTSLFADTSKLFRIEREEKTFKSVELTPEDLTISLEKNWEIR